MTYRIIVFILSLILPLECTHPLHASNIRYPSDWPEDELFVFPNTNSKSILSAIREAKAFIDVGIYRLEDKEILNNLIDAKRRGVEVRIILQKPNLYPEPFANSQNEETENILSSYGINTHYLPEHKYILTHYKFIIFDKSYALVQTLNYDSFNLTKARNFALATNNKLQVKALNEIFDNDFSNKTDLNDKNSMQFWKTCNIIIGPNNQQEAITELLKSAKYSVWIYQQDITDSHLASIIRNISLEGKDVKILMTPTPFGGIDLNRINHTLIETAGGKTRFLTKEDLYIHAKVIIIDAHNNGKAYIGSCNFWNQALIKQRELGIVTTKDVTLSKISAIFESDWQKAIFYP
jgi:cardiolipin synthase